MKITRDTPSQLIVENRPIFIAAILLLMALVFLSLTIGLLWMGEIIGLAFLLGVLLSGACLYIFSRRVQLIFNADSATLTVQRKNMRNASVVVHPLNEVKRAILEQTTSDNSTLYRVTLEMTGQSAGMHPITTGYSNVGQHRAVADAINRWLDSVRTRA